MSAWPLRWLLTAVLLLAYPTGLAHAGGRPVRAPTPPKLGDSPADHAPLTDIPVMHHVAASLPERSPKTMAAILARSGPSFVTAPDPSPYLRAQAALDRGPADGTPLRVLTYNVGLLDRGSFLRPHAHQNPHVPARRAHIPERILGDDWDVLLLQEVWDWSDVTRIAEVADRTGYVWFAGSKRHHNRHGLMILVRGELITGAQVRTEGRFEEQLRWERWSSKRIERGYLTWSFTHAPTKRPIRLATAQLQPHPRQWRTRTLQARQLGLDLASTPDDTIVILGADLDGAPYYPEDTFGEEAGRPVSAWWQSALPWPALQYYGHLHDVRNLGQMLDDVRIMHALPEWNSGWPKRALNGDCGMLPADVFTTTDCNSLHFQTSQGNGYPARTDHVFLRAPDRSTTVHESNLAYVQPESVRGPRHELSEHYGVQADIRIQPLD